jgi:hypothetical protein
MRPVKDLEKGQEYIPESAFGLVQYCYGNEKNFADKEIVTEKDLKR